MKLWAILLIGLAVAASGCVNSSNTNPSDNGNQAAPNNSGGNNTVFYTSSGFQPSTITVKKGETVTWVDSSGAPMWVASNQHPIHSGYDGTSLAQHCSNGQSDTFDSCKSRSTYSFTFDKKGSWSYHNHLSPGYTGTVTVR